MTNPDQTINTEFFGHEHVTVIEPQRGWRAQLLGGGSDHAVGQAATAAIGCIENFGRAQLSE